MQKIPKLQIRENLNTRKLPDIFNKKVFEIINASVVMVLMVSKIVQTYWDENR